MNQILKNKFAKVLLVIIAVAFGIYSINGIGKVGRQVKARNISEDIGKAVEQLKKSPPGTQRLEMFLQKLKAIDTKTAPTDLKKSLDEYIIALQKSLEAFKSGATTTTAIDQEIIDKKSNLSQTLDKYLN